MTITPLHRDEPLPTIAGDLCPGPCHEGDLCFCALQMGLVHEGVKAIRKKYPTMTKEQAALLVGEAAVSDVAIVAEAVCNADVATRYARTLMTKAVSLI